LQPCPEIPSLVKTRHLGRTIGEMEDVVGSRPNGSLLGAPGGVEPAHEMTTVQTSGLKNVIVDLKFVRNPRVEEPTIALAHRFPRQAAVDIHRGEKRQPAFPV